MFLRDYEYVTEVARTGSILRSAEKLCLSASALSKYIRKLEEELGVPLFDREGKTFVLTYAGEIYVRQAKEVLALNAQLEQTMESLRNRQTGRVRLGFPRFRTPFVIRKVLPVFRERFPEVQLVIRENSTRMIERMLKERELDLIMIQSDRSDPELSCLPLKEEERVVAVPKGHPLAAKAAAREGFAHPWIDLHEFAEEEFIVCYPEQAARQLGDAIFREYGMSPPIAFQARGIDSCLMAVGQGLGCSLIPADGPVEDLDCADQVELLSFGETPVKSTLVLAYRRDRYQSEVERAMIEVIREALHYNVTMQGRTPQSNQRGRIQI